ncbi:hypothetical protein [Massilia sp. CF038]|uniref:hypothetical protein n=1 Tax=Massilia sp. CF038 TaxID=1881045 RepID=UPI0015B761C0|nr:hypothetical protein [Massilia sp. CF038]
MTQPIQLDEKTLPALRWWPRQRSDTHAEPTRARLAAHPPAGKRRVRIHGFFWYPRGGF